ncbi:effector-associated domain EAD1-containing protein [Kitasatospora sp. NPDC085879]|uniref:effector-associated domain EAD1-containing protein n=1 Tax=Kitasatospora sp. NPDC085879 TaxID=3154769 RepID=UPI00342F84FB
MALRLSGADRRHLVEAVVTDYEQEDLQQELSYIDRRLAAISTGADLRTTVHRVVEEAERAGWLEELLGALRNGRFPAVAALADRLLTAVPPAAGYDDRHEDPYATDLLGQRLFLDRTLLRAHLKDLVSDSRSRVLLVTGPRSCGKSYTWYLVSHVAQHLQTFKPILVDLSEWADQVCTPFDLMSSVASQLKLPEPTVDQYAQGAAQARRLRDWLVGQLYDESVRAKYLLVVDSLDHVPLQADTAALIDHLAGAAIRERLPGLRVVLLGYGRPGLDALDSVLTEPVGTIDRRVLCDFFARLATGLDTDIAPPVIENIVDRMLDMLPADRATAIRELPGTVRDTANAVFDRQVLR